MGTGHWLEHVLCNQSPSVGVADVLLQWIYIAIICYWIDIRPCCSCGGGSNRKKCCDYCRQSTGNRVVWATAMSLWATESRTRDSISCMGRDLCENRSWKMSTKRRKGWRLGGARRQRKGVIAARESMHCKCRGKKFGCTCCCAVKLTAAQCSLQQPDHWHRQIWLLVCSPPTQETYANNMASSWKACYVCIFVESVENKQTVGTLQIAPSQRRQVQIKNRRRQLRTELNLDMD